MPNFSSPKDSTSYHLTLYRFLLPNETRFLIDGSYVHALMQENLDRVFNRAYLRELRKGTSLTDRFIQFSKLNLTTDVFDTEKKFHLSLASSEEDDLAHFGHSVNYATFYAHGKHNDELMLSIGSKMTIGHNEGRATFGKGASVTTEAAHRGTVY